MTTLAEAAVLLARRGYRVLPVGADKAPLLARGFHDATTDESVIALWSEAFGSEGGGLAIVIPDRTFVLDVDPRNGGWKTFEAVVTAQDRSFRTRTVLTRNGGKHYYFALPDDRELRGSLGPGIDIKKPGKGYVLVPPTAGYVYAIGGRPQPAPQWLLDELTVQRRDPGTFGKPKFFPFMPGTAYGIAVLKDELAKIRALEEGNRRATLNATSFKLAGLVASGELNEDKTLEQLLEASLDIGLDEGQALSRIKSGWDAGLQKPWGPE